MEGNREGGGVIRTSFKSQNDGRDRLERRVVQYDDRFFLVCLYQKGVIEKTGRVLKRPVTGVGPAREDEYEESRHTGKFTTERIIWVTNSVAQMTNEELDAIQAFSKKQVP